MKKIIKIGLLLVSSISLTLSLNAKEFNKETGLIIAPGMELVKANCTACHSAKFITLQKGNRATWLEMIRWMQRTQGLWEFDATTEVTILDYLEVNYAPDAASRRPLISKEFLPK